MKKLIIEFVLGKPKTALFLSLIVFLLSIPGLFKLTEEFGYKAWYSNDDPLMKLYQAFEKKFGNDDAIIITLYDEKGILSKENLEIVQNISKDLWLVQDIYRVDSLINYDYIVSENDEINVEPLIDLEQEIDVQKIIARLKKDKVAEGLFIDKNQTFTLIQGHLRPAFSNPPDYSKITIAVETLLKKYKKNGLKIKILGGVALSHFFKEASLRDIRLLLPAAILIFCFILVYIYRRASGVLLPYFVIGPSILSMMGIAGYLGKTLNMMSSAAPTILLTVAIADSIHIITSFFLKRNEGVSQVEAVRYSLDKNFLPTLFTSLTTAIGFISFAQAKVKAIADIGVLISIGVLFAWFYSYFILGSLLKIIPLKVIKREKRKIQFNSLKLTEWLDQKKKLILILTFLSIVLSFFFGMKLKVNMDPIGQFRTSHDLVKAVDLMSSKMGYFANMEIQVDSGQKDGIKNPAFLKKVDEFQRWLEKNPVIAKTYSAVDIVKNLNEKFNNGNQEFYKVPENQGVVAEELFFYTLGLPQGRDLNNRISINNRFLRVTVNWNVRDSVAANALMKKIKAKAKDLKLDMVITGKMPLFHDLTGYIVKTFFNSFLFAFIAITLILIFILKSSKLAFLALIPNIYPLLMGALLYYISGNFIDVGTVIVASVCLGIAVDDSIHFLFEYKRYRLEGLDIKQSINRLVNTTYPALLFTTLTIFVGFGSFAFAEYVPNARFGVMVSLILIFALVADFIILPAILFYTDRK